MINYSSFSPVTVSCGVPQSFVLGPFLFSPYSIWFYWGLFLEKSTHNTDNTLLYCSLKPYTSHHLYSLLSSFEDIVGALK